MASRYLDYIIRDDVEPIAESLRDLNNLDLKRGQIFQAHLRLDQDLHSRTQSTDILSAFDADISPDEFHRKLVSRLEFVREMLLGHEFHAFPG